MENLKQEVQKKFAEIRNALCMREKLLLRQAEVILQQTTQQQLGRGTADGQTPTEISQINFLAEHEDQLFTAIRNFGRFRLDNMNLTLQDVYLRNEDYITPANDHETMYKCLQQSDAHEETALGMLNEDEEQPEAIVVDFSRNKSLIEHNALRSIINITLQEAKELIKKAKLKRDTPIPPLNLEELDDELESSIAEAVSSLGRDSSAQASYTQPSIETKTTKAPKKASSNRFKPKITINNCNGTINLRNISSLTINCANEDSISAQIPLPQSEEGEVTNERNDVESTLNSVHNKSSNKCGHNSKPKNSEKIRTSATTTTTNTTISDQKSATILEAAESSTDSTPTPTTTASSSNYSSNSSSRSQSKKQKNKNSNKTSQSNTKTSQEPTTTTSVAYPYGMVDYDDDDCDGIESHAVNCDFYNRLLKEIKNSLQTKRPTDNTHYAYRSNDESNAAKNTDDIETQPQRTNVSSRCNPNSNTSSYISSVAPTSNTIASQPSGAGRRLVLKNFENLRIVLEANSSDEESFHPVQIEQWLAEIISETDLEPMQNTDILEHSKIHEESN